MANWANQPSACGEAQGLLSKRLPIATIILPPVWCFTPAGTALLPSSLPPHSLQRCTTLAVHYARCEVVARFASRLPLCLHVSLVPWLHAAGFNFLAASSTTLKQPAQGAGAGETCHSVLRLRNVANRSPTAHHVFFRHAFAPRAGFPQERILLRHTRPPCAPAAPQLCQQRQAKAFIRRC